jgi:PAS domain S-box-containing protein
LESRNLEDIPEEKIQTRFNGVRILHTKKIPIINSFGEAEFLLGISEDITVRKQIEDALKESVRMYRTLLNASPEGIVILDMDERIIEVSNITIEIFGAKNKNEFLGQDFFRFIPDNETEKLKDVLRRTLFEGLVQNVEFVLKTKNQVQFICELSTTLIQESDGKPKSYMAILRDISERKRIENQLIRTERLVSLGEMASAMAHEINQPLLSISLGIDNLLMKIQQSKSVDQVYFHNKSEKIFEDILRIGRIIDHVRAFSRDHDEFILSSFDINESINNAISMISEQFKHHGIGMSVKLDPNVHPIIGNTYRFEQVILNLLTNAKDALDEKTKSTNIYFEKAITIRSYHDYKTNYVEIKDNGIGVSPQDIDRIMLPFYTTKEVGIGTGLGLSVSFGIIKELNGNIDIESKPNLGTLFRISIPIKQEKEKHVKNNSSSQKS